MEDSMERSKVRSIHIGCSQRGGVGGPKGYVQVQRLSKGLREVADWGRSERYM